MERLPTHFIQSDIIRGPRRNDPLNLLIATAVDDCSNPNRMSIDKSQSSRVYDLEDIQKGIILKGLSDGSSNEIPVSKVTSFDDSEAPESVMKRNKSTSFMVEKTSFHSMKGESKPKNNRGKKDTKRKGPENVSGVDFVIPKRKKKRQTGRPISKVESSDTPLRGSMSNAQDIHSDFVSSFVNRNVMEDGSYLIHNHKFKVNLKIENTDFKATKREKKPLFAIVKSNSFLKATTIVNNKPFLDVKTGNEGTMLDANDSLNEKCFDGKVASLDVRRSYDILPPQDAHAAVLKRSENGTTCLVEQNLNGPESRSSSESQDKILNLNEVYKYRSSLFSEKNSDSYSEGSSKGSQTDIVIVPIMNEACSDNLGYNLERLEDGGIIVSTQMTNLDSSKAQETKTGKNELLINEQQTLRKSTGEFKECQDISVSDEKEQEKRSPSQSAVVNVGLQQHTENFLDDNGDSHDTDCFTATDSSFDRNGEQCHPNLTSNSGIFLVESPESKSSESSVSLDELLPQEYNERRHLLIPSPAIILGEECENENSSIQEHEMESTFSGNYPTTKFSKPGTNIDQEIIDNKAREIVFQTNEECSIEVKDDDVIEPSHVEHLGNKQFRKLIDKYATLSNQLTETEIAKMIVEDIKPGRFLVMKQDTWTIASFRVVIKRVKMALSSKGDQSKAFQLKESKEIKEHASGCMEYSSGTGTKDMITPCDKDVLAGRHPKHPGNREFESLILEYARKPVSETLSCLELIKQEIKPGRFLHLENGHWSESSNMQISDKVNLALSRARRVLEVSQALDKSSDTNEPETMFKMEDDNLHASSPQSASEVEITIAENEIISTDVIIGLKRYSQHLGVQLFQNAIDEHASLLGADVPIMTVVQQVDAALQPARFIFKHGNTLKLMPLEGRYQVISEALEKQHESLCSVKSIRSHRQRQSLNSEARRTTRQEREKIRHDIDAMKKVLEEKDDDMHCASYVEDLAWRKYTLEGRENDDLSSLLPLPPPEDLPQIPTDLEDTSCIWRLDSENRILKVTLKSGMTLSEKAKEYLYTYMERDDLALVMNGFYQNLDESLWNTESMKFKSGEMYHHRFRRFKKSPIKVEEDSSEVPCRHAQNEYVEIDKDFSMKVSSFFDYLEKRQSRSKMTSDVAETASHFSYLDMSGAAHDLDLDESIYMLDYDVKKKLPLHFQDFKDSFCFPEILPGGRMCAMYAVNEAARPDMGPNLYVTPPGSFTRFHQDGYGTVDSGHLCLSGYNEVVILRRLPRGHDHNAINVRGKLLYEMPHADLSDIKTADWPTKSEVERMNSMNYCAIVLILGPGEHLHIGKGRFHAFRKLGHENLPESDCHYVMRQQIHKLLEEQNIAAEELVNISLAWDWSFLGATSQGINREMASTLEYAFRNRNFSQPKQSLAIPKLCLLASCEASIAALCSKGITFGIKSHLAASIQSRHYAILAGLLPTLEFVVAQEEQAVQKVEKIATKSRKRKMHPHSWENPAIFPLDPYGNSDYFCKICFQELSNTYMHCEGCEDLLKKDFNVCSECYADMKHCQFFIMNEKGTAIDSMLNHTGAFSRSKSKICFCSAGKEPCTRCGHCRKCSCSCHQSFALQQRMWNCEKLSEILCKATNLVGDRKIDFFDEVRPRLLAALIWRDSDLDENVAPKIAKSRTPTAASNGNHELMLEKYVFTGEPVKPSSHFDVSPEALAFTAPSHGLQINMGGNNFNFAISPEKMKSFLESARGICDAEQIFALLEQNVDLGQAIQFYRNFHDCESIQYSSKLRDIAFSYSPREIDIIAYAVLQAHESIPCPFHPPNLKSLYTAWGNAAWRLMTYRPKKKLTDRFSIREGTKNLPDRFEEFYADEGYRKHLSEKISTLFSLMFQHNKGIDQV